MDELRKDFIEKTVLERTYVEGSKATTNLDVDWRKGSFYAKRYTYGCFCLFLFSFLSFFSGILYYENDYKIVYLNDILRNKTINETLIFQEGTDDYIFYNARIEYLENEDGYNLVRDTSQYVILLLSIMTGFTFAMIHSEYIDWKKAIGMLSQDNTFVKSKEFKFYVINAIMLFIQPYYFLNNYRYEILISGSINKPKLNYLFLQFFLMIRFYYIIKYFIVSSYFFTPRAQRFASMYQIEVNLSFAVKCILKSSPLFCLLVLYLSNVGLGGYFIRLWERWASDKPNENFDNLVNCVWYAFITMTTVGYGDMFAFSVPGRIMAIFVAIFGVFINSILTVVLTENFTFQGGELRAYNMLNQIELKETFDLVSKKLFTKCIRIFHVRLHKNKNYNNPLIMKKFENLEIYFLRERDQMIRNLKEVQENIKNSFNIDPVDLIINKLTDVRKSIDVFKSAVNDFKHLVETEKENQRNLETLKNTILSNDIEEDNEKEIN